MVAVVGGGRLEDVWGEEREREGEREMGCILGVLWVVACIFLERFGLGNDLVGNLVGQGLQRGPGLRAGLRAGSCGFEASIFSVLRHSIRACVSACASGYFQLLILSLSLSFSFFFLRVS